MKDSLISGTRINYGGLSFLRNKRKFFETIWSPHNGGLNGPSQYVLCLFQQVSKKSSSLSHHIFLRKLQAHRTSCIPEEEEHHNALEITGTWKPTQNMQ